MSSENKASILAVDDNTFVLDTVRFILEGEEYNVVACSDPEEAVVNSRKRGLILSLQISRCRRSQG